MVTIDMATILQVAIALTAVVACVMSILMFLVTRNRSRSEYDAARNMAMLSEMRTAYDHQLARISSQLMATEDRWRETNHLLISSQNHQRDDASPATLPRSKFISDLGIDQTALKVDPDLVFFLTPFTEEEYPLYQRVQQICLANGFKCVRGDESQAEGDILPHIVRLILRSRFVIANITTRNPNVFYELGIAHALDKQTVLIARSGENLPFDIQSKRTVIFRNFKELDSKLTRTFVRMFSADA